MRFISSFAISMTILLLVANCSSTADHDYEFNPGQVVAWVGDEPIYNEFFEETYANFLARTGMPDSRAQRYAHLHTLMDMVLMANAAEQEGLKDDEYERYMRITRQRSLRNRFLKYEFLDSLDNVNEDQVRIAYYNDQQKMYVSQLYFTDESRAHAYYERLESGEPFVQLANELYGLESFDPQAGYLGEISYFGVDDVFAETAFSLKAGEHSKPVRTRQGWVIIRAENWNINPIVTETEYSARRDKYEFFAFQRVYNIEADKWIRDYMQGLNPEPILDNAEQLHYAIQSAMVRPELLDARRHPIEQANMSRLDDLDPMMPLVTYTLDGELQAFRLHHYLDWIEHLPYEEVVNRLVPSLGRALMWQVFADQAVAKGYQNDPFIDFNAHYSSILHLAGRYEDSLAARPHPEFEEEDLQAAFEQFGMGTMTSAKASFWIKKVEDFQIGRELKNQIEEDPEALAGIAGVEYYTMADIYEVYPTVATHLRRTLKNQPFVVGTQEGWYLFEVQDREIEFHTLDDRRDAVKERLSPHYNKYLFLREHRNRVVAEVDTTVFESLMPFRSRM
ncbi:MAG: peptidyl-prolyl cis-trans isomerase [Balneolaceae bacterium]